MCEKEEVVTKAKNHELVRIALLENESRRNYLDEMEEVGNVDMTYVINVDMTYLS